MLLHSVLVAHGLKQGLHPTVPNEQGGGFLAAMLNVSFLPLLDTVARVWVPGIGLQIIA